MMVVWKMI